MLIAIIILGNVTQGTASQDTNLSFYGQFAEQASFSWDFAGFCNSMFFLPTECQFTSAPSSLPNQGQPQARAVYDRRQGAYSSPVSPRNCLLIFQPHCWTPLHP